MRLFFHLCKKWHPVALIGELVCRNGDIIFLNKETSYDYDKEVSMEHKAFYLQSPPPPGTLIYRPNEEEE